MEGYRWHRPGFHGPKSQALYLCPPIHHSPTLGHARHNAYFVDLFVRASNQAAITMYEHFGYSVYRRVIGYYSGDPPEDALGESRRGLLLHWHTFGNQRTCPALAWWSWKWKQSRPAPLLMVLTPPPLPHPTTFAF